MSSNDGMPDCEPRPITLRRETGGAKVRTYLVGEWPDTAEIHVDLMKNETGWGDGACLRWESHDRLRITLENAEALYLRVPHGDPYHVRLRKISCSKAPD